MQLEQCRCERRMALRWRPLPASRLGVCRKAALRPSRHLSRAAEAQHVAAPEASGTPTTQTASQQGLVLGPSQDGAWDAAAVGRPIVRCYMGDQEERWFMWYNGRGAGEPGLDAISPAAGSMGLAVSSNGVDWQRGSGDVQGMRGDAQAADIGRVLAPNADWWCHDTAFVCASDVQIMSNSSVSDGVGVYWCYYSGGSFEEAPAPDGILGLQQGATVAGLRQRPGLAMSQDGRNWARIEGEHHTGALFDAGQEGDWNEHYVASPQVLNVGPGDMLMYYHSWCPQRRRFCVGLTTGPDGFRWEQQGVVFEGSCQPGSFDSQGVLSSHVSLDVPNRQFLMLYEGVDDSGCSSIGAAVSGDGRTGWRCLPEAVLRPSAAGWDRGGVGTPCAVSMADGRWRVYYSGRSTSQGPWTGIGLALTDLDKQVLNGAQVGLKRRSGQPPQAAMLD